MSQEEQKTTKITLKNAKNEKTMAKTDKKAQKLAKKQDKKAKKSQKEEKPIKEYFILARPFVRFGRYLRDSWRELRQVRWPNRAATWKMTGAVLVYCAMLMVFILLLDMLFTFIFDKLLG